MRPTKIMDKIWWVGVQDPGLRVFDVIMETKWGTSYNSYLVMGSEKTALIDSVKNGFLEEQLEGLREICDPSKIDYIVCNHTEPDHSGSLRRMLEVAPNAVVVCTQPAKNLIKEIINRDFECIVAKDGDTISLGDKTLRFILAPFLHWPDTMFTYVEESHFLSTCDAFGFHYCAPELFDDMAPMTSTLVNEQKYYFDTIMSPFKSYVLDAVEKIRDLKIDVIAPSHGPVLRSDPWANVFRYKKWAEPDPYRIKNIYIGYVSAYGNTKAMAEELFRGVRESGLEAVCEDVSQMDACSVAAKIHGADAFALGSPTINRDALEPVWQALINLCTYAMKGKKAAVVGSFGWSGEACKYMSQRLANIGVDVIGEARCKLVPNEEELKGAYELGKALGETLK